MKCKMLFALCILAYQFSTAQIVNPKTALTNATMSLDIYETDQSQVAELSKAKENIDFAADHEATKNDPKVWKYKGKIYNRIIFDPVMKLKHTDAALVSIKAWKKGWELDMQKLVSKGKPASKMPSKMDYKQGFELASRGLYNAGADAYNAQNYEFAYNCFSEILDIQSLTGEALSKKPIDLTINGTIDLEKEGQRLGGMSAAGNGQCDIAKKMLLPMLESNKIDAELAPSTYSILVKCYENASDMNNAKSLLEKAREKYPTDQNLLISQINMALKEGNLSEIEDKLKMAVEMDKENVELHFVLGNVYDDIFRKNMEEGNKEEANSFYQKAIDWYTKATKINPNHYNSVYSLGAIHVNYSNSIAKERNEIVDYKDPRLDELDKEYTALLEKALGFLLTAEKINPKDIGSAIALKEVYARLKKYDQAEEYGKKVKALQGK
jgi:tetratricopeptide (TPR) repeat protein